MLTERQRNILKWIVKDYIELAKPISSEFLEKKHKPGISPATIRNEFQALTKKGYLLKPHTSSGRVPTDKAYRFFVDNLAEREFEKFEIGDFIEEKIKDCIEFLQNLTKSLAKISKALVFSYLKEKNLVFKEGWDEILKEPEFFEKECVFHFLEFVESFEKGIGKIKINSEIRVFIGKENFFPKGKEFSILISKCYLPKRKETIFSILGPKRMNYNRNIGILNSLRECFRNYERGRVKKRN